MTDMMVSYYVYVMSVKGNRPKPSTGGGPRALAGAGATSIPPNDPCDKKLDNSLLKRAGIFGQVDRYVHR